MKNTNTVKVYLYVINGDLFPETRRPDYRFLAPDLTIEVPEIEVFAGTVEDRDLCYCNWAIDLALEQGKLKKVPVYVEVEGKMIKLRDEYEIVE